jgi:hypothetical protein
MRYLLLICLLPLICFSPAFAEEVVPAEEVTPAEDVTNEEEEHLYIYEFPKIKPEYTLTGGFRFIEIDGSDRAAEYEYPDNSLIFEGEYRAIPYPHRFHLEVDFLNKKDYFGDFSYAYKDIILTRWLSRSIFHNLENTRLIDAGPSERFTVDVTDPFQKYDLTTKMNNVFIRFKLPDYPLHLYAEGDFINKDGEKQLKFLGGSGYFNDLRRTTKKRDADWDTRNVKVGFNTHAGPVEFDISHSEKRFDSGGDRVFYDFYRSGDGRQAGLYPHSLIPDFKGSKDTLKLHTSFTGKLVASVTLLKYSTENEYSRANSDYFLGSADVTWMPMPKLTFFAKYRHRETDVDNPDTVTITDQLDPSNSYTYPVRPSISSKKDSISGILRYRAFKGVTFDAKFSHLNTERENADEWKLPSTTVKDTASLSVKIRIKRNIYIKSSYVYEAIDAPAYNIESDRKDKGVIALSWTPSPYIMTYLSYDAFIGKSDNIRYNVSDQQVIVGDGEVSAGKLFAMVGVSIAKNISIDTSYAYMHNKTTQPLIYGTDNEPAFVADNDVPYKEKVHTFAVNLNYRPKKNIDLLTGISYTKSKANFYPYAEAAVEPVSIADFSEIDIQQIGFTLQGQYEFKKGWEAGLRYSYSDFDYVYNNPLNPYEDSNAHIVLLSISKRWM